MAVKGVSSSVLPQPRPDEMLQRADSGPSRNNSGKCQASVSEMRSAEVSGAFCCVLRFPLRATRPSPHALRQDEDKEPRHHREAAALCTSILHPARRLLCMKTNCPHRKKKETASYRHTDSLRNSPVTHAGLTGTTRAQTTAQHPPAADSDANRERKKNGKFQLHTSA